MISTLEICILLLVVIVSHIIVLVLLRRKPKKSILGRHIVVTGGSSGIGLWIAIYCAKLGANVSIIARNTSLLEKAKVLIESHRLNESQIIEYRSIDLSQSYDVVSKEFAEINSKAPIYMLANCAGLAICGTVENISVEDARKMMDVNYYGTYYPTRFCLPKMKAAGDGIIVMTASQAALLGIYGYGPYAASKFALRGLAETIAMESSHYGVSVTLALPADTDTPGLANENKSKPAATKEISGSGGLFKPEQVARQIVDDALRGSFISILGFESWLVTLNCAGLAPWGGIGLTILSAICVGPLKLIGAGIQWNFRRICRNCDNNTTSSQQQKS